MFHIVLYQPEIPPNTGNIMRLCANTGTPLHLIRPLGFALDDSRLRRAGLDYRELMTVHSHASLEAFSESVGPARILAASTRGSRGYAEVDYRDGDAILFGPETRGLPQTVLDDLAPDCVLRIPMRAGSRSINLSNAVAIILYEASRQTGFAFDDPA